MDGPTQKQYGILLLDKRVDGWVGWRASRYQTIQELEKPVGKEGGVIWRFISSLWARCAVYLSPFPSLSCLFCSLSSLTRWLRDCCHFRIVFWEIIRVRVKPVVGNIRVARPAACFAFCAALLLRCSGVYRKSFLASLHFFFWCVVHYPVWLLACREPDVEHGMFSGKRLKERWAICLAFPGVGKGSLSMGHRYGRARNDNRAG